MMNPLRSGLITTLVEMGAAIERLERTPSKAAKMLPICAFAPATLRGVEVPGSRAPSMIDEYPVLAVAAAFAEGTTVLRGLKELRVKESDRLAATAALLRVNGVAVDIAGDDLIVHGQSRAARRRHGHDPYGSPDRHGGRRSRPRQRAAGQDRRRYFYCDELP